MAEWRVGRKLGRTLYRDEVFMGILDSPEVAAEIVEALNTVAAARRVWERVGDGRMREWTDVGDPPPESGRERSLSLPPGVEVRREEHGGTVVAISEQVVFCAQCPDPPWPSREFHPTGGPEHHENPDAAQHVRQSAGGRVCGCRHCRSKRGEYLPCPCCHGDGSMACRKGCHRSPCDVCSETGRVDPKTKTNKDVQRILREGAS